MFFLIKSLSSSTAKNKKIKKWKLVALLVLFIVLVVGLSYFGFPVRTTCLDEYPGKVSTPGSNRDFSLKIFALIICVILLGKSIFSLIDLVVEVKPLFSSISFVLCAIVGVHLIIYGENFAFLPLAGSMICFLMILLLIRTCLIWQERRAIKKTE